MPEGIRRLDDQRNVTLLLSSNSTSQSMVPSGLEGRVRLPDISVGNHGNRVCVYTA